MSDSPPIPRRLLIREPELSLLREPREQIRYALIDDGDLAVVSVRGALIAHVVHEDQPHDDSVPLVIVLGENGRIRALSSGARPVPVTIVPAGPRVFDRLDGIFPSDRLRNKHVLCVGLGSGGSYVLRELVRSGIGHFTLIDHDRLEVSNVCRHELGLRDVGRLKVLALRDYIRDRHPEAEVDTYAWQVDGTTLPQLLELVRETRPDVLVCGTDNRESRLLVNRVALLTDTVAIYGGVRRRAYAGQVIRVVPHITPCYQCFVHSLGRASSDVEISSEADARRYSYSDRTVTAEPGLSADIAPVALLIAKLALLELTGDVPSQPFDSQRADLVASWFFWLNRREAGTPFADWPAMRDVVDRPSILRWMGQHLERQTSCPACGDQARYEVAVEDVAFFTDERAT